VKLIILAIAGAILLGIPLYVIVTDPSSIVYNLWVVFVAGFGGFLLMLAFHYGVRKADRLLDRD